MRSDETKTPEPTNEVQDTPNSTTISDADASKVVGGAGVSVNTQQIDPVIALSRSAIAARPGRSLTNNATDYD